MRIDVLGVKFDNISVGEAAEKAMKLSESLGVKYTVTPNPEIVYTAYKNEELLKVLNAADLVLPDGIGVVYGSRILKTPLNSRVPGIEFAERLMELMAGTEKKLYLFGAKPGVAETAAAKLSEKYPGLCVCGTHDGYFKDDSEIIEEINSLKPDFIFVCLGAPKQELWISDNAEKLKQGFYIGLGGSLDVFAGTVNRAPRFWQKMQLEWLYRILKEPKRIKRAGKLPLFIFAVIQQRLKGGKK